MRPIVAARPRPSTRPSSRASWPITPDTRALDRLSDAERLEFVEAHADWIGNYADALAAMDRPDVAYGDCRWRQPDVYRGSFGQVCEPFLRLLHDELVDAIDSASRGDGPPPVAASVAGDIALHLVTRFELAMAWALETDINVYCLQNGIDKGGAGPADYDAYLQGTFADRASYHRFYCKFPVLARGWRTSQACCAPPVGSCSTAS